MNVEPQPTVMCTSNKFDVVFWSLLALLDFMKSDNTTQIYLTMLKVKHGWLQMLITYRLLGTTITFTMDTLGIIALLVNIINRLSSPKVNIGSSFFIVPDFVDLLSSRRPGAQIPELWGWRFEWKCCFALEADCSSLSHLHFPFNHCYHHKTDRIHYSNWPHNSHCKLVLF